MTTITTPTSPEAWRPDVQGFAPAEVVPEALIIRVGTFVGYVEGDAPAIRVPWVADDGDASFVPEGAPIPESEADLAETVVHTHKVATLSKYSSEMLRQQNAAEIIMQAQQRAVVARADRAFLGSDTDPLGLLNTAGITDGGKITTNLDPLADAITAIEATGGTATHIIAAPGAWGTVSKIKTGTGSAAPLLGSGAEATERRALGLPVVTSAAMPATQMLVVDSACILSAYGGVVVDRSDHAYFGSDVVGVRTKWRIGWSIQHPDRVVKIATA